MSQSQDKEVTYSTLYQGLPVYQLKTPPTREVIYGSKTSPFSGESHLTNIGGMYLGGAFLGLTLGLARAVPKLQGTPFGKPYLTRAVNIAGPYTGGTARMLAVPTVGYSAIKAAVEYAAEVDEDTDDATKRIVSSGCAAAAGAAYGAMSGIKAAGIAAAVGVGLVNALAAVNAAIEDED